MEQFVVVVLNGYGVTVVGPFDTWEEAASYGNAFYEHKDWWAEKIITPEPSKRGNNEA